jgi:hypothetical protein
MPNPRSTFRPIAPKPRELSREFPQEPPRGREHPQDFNSDIIAVATLTSPQPFIPEIQEITPMTYRQYFNIFDDYKSLQKKE